MKNVLRVSLVVTLLLFYSTEASAQIKEYGNVYISVKKGDTWGGLTKIKAQVFLDKPGKGDDYPITVRLVENGSIYSSLNCEFEAKTGDGRAFHKIVGGGVAFADPVWKSPTGSSKINWVYLNKSIHEIHAGEPKPFDLELQFEDGSAVKYFISPAY